jgi:Filamin/ABP280 repeat
MEHVAANLPIEVSLTHNGKEFHVGVSQSDGQYCCEYTPEEAGFYILHVTSRGRAVGGSPFSVQASCPPPPPSHPTPAPEELFAKSTSV